MSGVQVDPADDLSLLFFQIFVNLEEVLDLLEGMCAQVFEGQTLGESRVLT